MSYPKINWRFTLINTFSFFKRFFYFDAQLYAAISLTPLLALLTSQWSKRGLIFAIIFGSYYLAFGKHVFLNYFTVFIVLQIALPLFKKMDFDDVLKGGIPLFAIGLIYGLYQKAFGYSAIEMAWINSGLGIVGSENFFITENIRPFSIFAGTPEFGFFFICYAYYFFSHKKWLLAVTAAAMLIPIGSRGLMISLTVAGLVLLLRNLNIPRRVLAIAGIAITFFVYVSLSLLSSFFNELNPGESRLLVYGTFNARVLSALEFFQAVDIHNIWTGVGHIFSLELASDNLYIDLLNNAGLIGLTSFVCLLLYDCKSDRQLFFLVVFFAYGFFAGIIPSLYFMFNFFVAYYANSLHRKRQTSKLHK